MYPIQDPLVALRRGLNPTGVYAFWWPSLNTTFRGWTHCPWQSIWHMEFVLHLFSTKQTVGIQTETEPKRTKGLLFFLGGGKKNCVEVGYLSRKVICMQFSRLALAIGCCHFSSFWMGAVGPVISKYMMQPIAHTSTWREFVLNEEETGGPNTVFFARKHLWVNS